MSFPYIERVAEENEENMVNLVEERLEKMVAHTGGFPTLRLARFLNPSLGETAYVPTLLNPKSFNTEKRLPGVQFGGWVMTPHKKWTEWVDQLSPVYGNEWKKMGIYDAIFVSTYTFRRDVGSLLGLTDFWCGDTNTFIFSWGEVTVTLEDLFIIGGFSVLGESAYLPLTEELLEVEEKLIKQHKKLYSSTISRKPTYGEWIECFTGSDENGLEHVAFLCYWLSRYVFPAKPTDIVGRHVFSIAIHLSNGTRIAVAPGILASIYRDLRVLKEKLVLSSTEGYESDKLYLITCAPFQILQLWAWERFSCLRPTPNPLNSGEPRAARWHEVKSISKFDSVRTDINSPDEFVWRPYSSMLINWSRPSFYKDQAEWVIVSPDIDDELLAFTRFIVPCELVGLDCIEQYLPHRVGMQFGMDQDIPGHFTRANGNWETAWDTYQNLVSGSTCLYIAPRLFESDVTDRYFDWWNEPSSPTPTHGDIGGVFLDPISPLAVVECPEGNTSPPLGIPSHGLDELGSSSDEDKMTISEWLKHQQGRLVNEGETRPLMYISHTQVQSSSSTTKKFIGTNDPLLAITGADLDNEVPFENNNTNSDEFRSEMCDTEVVEDTNEIMIPGLELEDRIGRLEKVVDKLRVVFRAREKKRSGQGTSNARE